ncbi:MFS transporter [Acinetobacter sp. HY1485]|uniref:MFS transporter n=1 Tax=Acinetobacter sp. HY1485 TaxID=2970918 RepID=UPI0022B96F36|nr:MFS transporter [Acinetobacter sp. HY1485]
MESLSNFQLNKRILSVVIFTFFTYISIGLPLAVLPQFVNHNLQYSSFIAGAIISLQYLATLITRPRAGRLADRLGARKVVLIGLSCCTASGILSVCAVWCANQPILSLVLLGLGRLCLGAGESFGGTGATLWGMNLVDRTEVSRVISWNGVGTYLAMAIGAPLGVLLNNYFSQAGFAFFTVAIAVLGLILAYRKPSIKVNADVDTKIAFLKVVSKVWVFGVGLALGTVGFGVISTFITLYFHEQHWANAAYALSVFSLGFVFIRLILARTIPRFGGIRVSLVSFIFEALGLFLIWQTQNLHVVYVGAFLVGAGFSLVFPALGVEAVKQVEVHHRGSALGVYNAFLDIALMLIGPIAGLLIPLIGMQNLYGTASGAILIAVALMAYLQWQNSRNIRYQ